METEVATTKQPDKVSIFKTTLPLNCKILGSENLTDNGQTTCDFSYFYPFKVTANNVV